MKHEFWLERWERDQIGFHQQAINAYLTEHWAELGLAPGAGVFVPLCGKSLDMLWLREQGYSVLGVELSRKAVEAFFNENGLRARRDEEGAFVSYSADRLRLLVGDFFALEPGMLSGIRAVYDRAALIALPAGMRAAYARHMAALLPSGAHILLVTLEYPAGALEGPPFAVGEEELRRLYGEAFSIERKASLGDVEGPRGVRVTERIYSLVRT